MRYRLMATYRGVPYEAGIGPSEADVVLFAACPPPEELGFEPATGHWRKQLHIEDVQALWESRPTGRFCGERCIVLDDLGDRLHIAYLGHDALQAEQLGYWQVDRGVFELITPREEVTDIVEERTDYPGRSTDMLPSASLSTEALDAAALPLAGPADGRQTAPAAPEQDASATRLADLAATTLAHLAAMSAAPGRAAAPGQAKGRSPDPAWDPSPHAGAPRGGIPADRANGSAIHSAEFAGPVAPDPWLAMPLGSDVAMPLGSEVAMPPPDEQPLPLEAAARRAASAATAAMRRQRRATPREPVAPDAAGTTEPADIPAIAGPAGITAIADPAGATAIADPAGITAIAHPAGATATGDPAGATATADPDGITATADPARATASAEHAVTAGTAEAIGRALRRQRREAGPPAPDGAPAADGTALSAGSAAPAGTAAPAETPRRRRAARKRVATQGIFSELASLAAIPPSAYAVGEEIDGAMCLVQTEQGFEVFNAAGGARHEARGFIDEESAYFYLFGVLAADAVRTGRLAPRPS